MGTQAKQIISEYQASLTNYQILEKKAISLLKDLLVQNDIKVFDVKGRVKAEKSLKEKLIRKQNQYQSLKDITDICGIRIITYYMDEINLIAEIIKSEFLIDQENSVDKRIMEKPNMFGYTSLHFIVQMNKIRSELAEYEKIKNLKFEIQIRTVMQHNWAEIEHELDYKGVNIESSEFTRRFSRLASLIELADDEFIALRKEYELALNTNEKLIPVQGESEITIVSLNDFVNKNAEYQKLLKLIETKLALKFVLKSGIQGLHSRYEQLIKLDYMQYATIIQDLHKYQDFIISQMDYRYKRYQRITAVQPLLFMMYAKACESNQSILFDVFNLNEAYIEVLLQKYKNSYALAV